jgi:hypothetical protein
MRNFFALVGLGAITFVGLGWYLDWYKLTRQPAPAGTQRVTIDLQPDKFTGDVRKGVERVGEISNRLRESSNNPNNPTPPADKGPASDFFSPPSANTTTNSPWKSLDSAPPPSPVPSAQLQPPRR